MAYQQTDWTSGNGQCLHCGGAIRMAGTGRPALYCSYAHKMKAYRQRIKALRNSTVNEKPLRNSTPTGQGNHQ